MEMWCILGHWSPDKTKIILLEKVVQKGYWSLGVTKEPEFSEQENKKYWLLLGH